MDRMQGIQCYTLPGKAIGSQGLSTNVAYIYNFSFSFSFVILSSLLIGLVPLQNKARKQNLVENPSQAHTTCGGLDVQRIKCAPKKCMVKILENFLSAAKEKHSSGVKDGGAYPSDIEQAQQQAQYRWEWDVNQVAVHESWEGSSIIFSRNEMKQANSQGDERGDRFLCHDWLPSNRKSTNKPTKTSSNSNPMPMPHLCNRCSCAVSGRVMFLFLCSNAAPIAMPNPAPMAMPRARLSNTNPRATPNPAPMLIPMLIQYPWGRFSLSTVFGPATDFLIAMPAKITATITTSAKTNRDIKMYGCIMNLL
jgi:hypothetical protein